MGGMGLMGLMGGMGGLPRGVMRAAPWCDAGCAAARCDLPRGVSVRTPRCARPHAAGRQRRREEGGHGAALLSFLPSPCSRKQGGARCPLPARESNGGRFALSPPAKIMGCGRWEREGGWMSGVGFTSLPRPRQRRSLPCAWRGTRGGRVRLARRGRGGEGWIS